MVFRTIRMRTVAAMMAVSVVAGGAAIAEAPKAPAAKIAPVSDAEATKFIAANKKVTALANTLTVELQAAKSEADAKVILDKGEAKMAAAIQTEGITPQRYTEIVQLAETDEATLAKLRAKFAGG